MLVNQKSHSQVDEFHQNFKKKDGGLNIGHDLTVVQK